MFRDFEVLIRRKVWQHFKFLYYEKYVARLKNDGYLIISNNCWGGQIYQWLGHRYNTPFIGLFLYGPCYMKLLADFWNYMNTELVFIDQSKYPDRPKTYPIGKLKDIEIHFTHYKSELEAKTKWNKRTERMMQSKRNDFHYMICDRERVSPEHIKKFHQLPLQNKLSFAIYGFDEESHIKIAERPKNNAPMCPNGKKLFKISFLYFDFIHWLNTGRVKRTRFKE